MSFKIGIALGCGGARGLAHIGVLKALQKNKIKVDIVAGSSIGAIIGALFSLNPDAYSCEKIVSDFLKREELTKLNCFIVETNTKENRLIFERSFAFVKDIYLWNLRIIKKWLIDPKPFRRLISDLLRNSNFRDLKIPFICVACDLRTGQVVNLDSGSLVDAVLSSSAIPGIFPPMKFDGRFLIDGGIIEAVPACAARQSGANFVVGVDVSEKIISEDVSNKSIDVFFRAQEIRKYHLNHLKLKNCDFVISPEVEQVNWADFSQGSFCIRKGQEKTEKLISELNKRINQAKFKYLLKSFIRL